VEPGVNYDMLTEATREAFPSFAELSWLQICIALVPAAITFGPLYYLMWRAPGWLTSILHELEAWDVEFNSVFANLHRDGDLPLVLRFFWDANIVLAAAAAFFNQNSVLAACTRGLFEGELVNVAFQLLRGNHARPRLFTSWLRFAGFFGLLLHIPADGPSDAVAWIFLWFLWGALALMTPWAADPQQRNWRGFWEDQFPALIHPASRKWVLRRDPFAVARSFFIIVHHDACRARWNARVLRVEMAQQGNFMGRRIIRVGFAVDPAEMHADPGLVVRNGITCNSLAHGPHHDISGKRVFLDAMPP